MSHAHSTTKRRTFKHLTAYQRGQIEAMLHLGVPKVKIAKELGIARSTLYAEIKRGTVTQKRYDWTYYEQYLAQSGQIRYGRNRENSGKPSKFNVAKDFIKYVEGYILKHGYAPDVICGRVKRMTCSTCMSARRPSATTSPRGCSRSKTSTCARRYAANTKRRKLSSTADGLGRVSSTVTRSLTNAVPSGIGNLTPLSGKRAPMPSCSQLMNVSSERGIS